MNLKLKNLNNKINKAIKEVWGNYHHTTGIQFKKNGLNML